MRHFIIKAKVSRLCGISAILAIILLLSSCGSGKPAPEEEVRVYGKYFVEKLASNQLDSLKSSYPDITAADSIAAFKSDTILVTETSQGKYDVKLAEGVVLKATRSEDGVIQVTSSKGVFTFRSDLVDLARKTGMWQDSLSDKQLSERMKDEEFFKQIRNNNKNRLSKLLVIGKSPGYPGGNQSVTNKSDKTIDGSDYNIVKAMYIRGNYFSPGRTVYSSVKGKTLKPGESMRVRVEVAMMGVENLENIKWLLPDEQLISKYVTFSGKEYQEYLDSKKSDTSLK